jgi:hypothetical protein
LILLKNSLPMLAIKNGGVSMRKGQGAMEYLMTYGWALLVIIIVGAALFALGVLNPATYQSKRCNGFSYFQYIDHVADDTNGDFSLHVRNGVSDITVTGLTLGSTAGANLAGSPDLTPSQGEEVVISADTLGGEIDPGAYDDLVVTVTYDVTNGISCVTDAATCVGSAV